VVIVWGIALVSVLSLLPYWGLLSRAREWDMIVRLPVSVEHLSNKLGEALSASGSWMPGFWVCCMWQAWGLPYGPILAQHRSVWEMSNGRSCYSAGLCCWRALSDTLIFL